MSGSVPLPQHPIATLQEGKKSFIYETLIKSGTLHVPVLLQLCTQITKSNLKIFLFLTQWAFSHTESSFHIQIFLWNKNQHHLHILLENILHVYASMCEVCFVFVGLFYFVVENLFFSLSVKFYFLKLNSVLIATQVVSVCV